ncbi:MAG: DEAD/DEAH box helicase, partial [Bacilli bacterium]|nr:DEAD/DEAH box helicase [Bacilli bacterium]
VIVPTRELGTQIYDEFLKITKYSKNDIDIRLYVGGTDRINEIERLRKSSPQIVIGTIGKLTDLAISENILKLHEAKIVVIDEADMVFEYSEIEEIDKLFGRFQDIEVLSFSATIPTNLKIFLDKYLDSALFIDLVGRNIKKDSIKHIFIPTKNKNKDELLCSLLKTFNPYLALIFANTVKKVDEISLYLAENGFKVGKLTGELEPRERKQVLKRIKDGIYQYVVCSDIAARGMDIVGVSHVINYELPSDIEYYIHRIGRTARFDQSGLAISFYDYDDESYLKKLKEKGLSYEFMVLKDGELKATKERNVKQKKESEAVIAIHKKHPVPKKVKPGYKKKRKEVIEKEIKKEKRARISEMYRKRAMRNKKND